jgi:transposase-like protein
MTKPIARDSIYRRRSFDADIIELCVRWYSTYRLSYRDLVAMMAERGVEVSHTTILRWVIRYVSEFEKRWNRRMRHIGSSWRVDETYIPIRGKSHYLYRAVDKQGKSVDFLLRRDRGIAAAQAFFRKALATNPTRWPRKVTLDGHTPSHQALRLPRRENPKWRYVEVRSCKYLNTIIEQDHRAIKRRCASMKGFKSFTNAASTIAGIKLAHRIHKRQFSFGLGRQHRNGSLQLRWQRALAKAGSCQVAEFDRSARPPLHRNPNSAMAD